MLTDDQITSRLRSAFDDATTDLHYTRRVTPPRPRAALVLAPAATLVGAAAVGVVALGQQQPAAEPAPRTITHAGPPSTVATSLGTPGPTSRIRFAGYVMTYRRSTAVSDDMAALVSDPVPVPSGARRATNADGVVAAVAQYPGTAKQALWVTLPTRNGGHPMALVSQGLTADQLVDLWQNGKPYPQ